jgi:hypothetical protein
VRLKRFVRFSIAAPSRSSGLSGGSCDFLIAALLIEFHHYGVSAMTGIGYLSKRTDTAYKHTFIRCFDGRQEK